MKKKLLTFFIIFDINPIILIHMFHWVIDIYQLSKQKPEKKKQQIKK